MSSKRDGRKLESQIRIWGRKSDIPSKGIFITAHIQSGFAVLEAERKAGTEVLLWSNVPQLLTRMICPELVQVLTYVISDRDLMAKVMEKAITGTTLTWKLPKQLPPGRVT